MGRKKIEIPKKKLESLYHKENKTPRQIGEVFGCSQGTIRNRLEEYDISIKDPAKARIQYPRSDFDGSPCERSYIIGFAVGDLNAYLPSESGSRTVVVRCHTTHDSQVNLFKAVFSPYGHVSVSSQESGSVHLNCYLNLTFRFLVEKYSNNVQEWLHNQNQDAKYAFTAGYTDAEGSFRINQGKARFTITAYDKKVMRDIKHWLVRDNICTCFRKIAEKGDANSRGKKWNQDLWRLQINEARSIQRFIGSIFPYLKHQGRRKDAESILDNVKQRIKNGTVT
jgi:hypothetical protein